MTKTAQLTVRDLEIGQRFYYRADEGPIGMRRKVSGGGDGNMPVVIAEDSGRYTNTGDSDMWVIPAELGQTYEEALAAHAPKQLTTKDVQPGQRFRILDFGGPGREKAVFVATLQGVTGSLWPDGGMVQVEGPDVGRVWVKYLETAPRRPVEIVQ